MGMSQKGLAEKLSVTFQQVQKYERGANRISVSRLFEVAAALDTPIAYFFEGLCASQSAHVRAHVDPSVAAMLETREGRQMVTFFTSIESRQIRQRVVEITRVLSQENVAAPVPMEDRVGWK